MLKLNKLAIRFALLGAMAAAFGVMASFPENASAAIPLCTTICEPNPATGYWLECPATPMQNPYNPRKIDCVKDPAQPCVPVTYCTGGGPY